MGDQALEADVVCFYFYCMHLCSVDQVSGSFRHHLLNFSCDYWLKTQTSGRFIQPLRLRKPMKPTDEMGWFG